jgi:hypothetical protein
VGFSRRGRGKTPDFGVAFTPDSVRPRDGQAISSSTGRFGPINPNVRSNQRTTRHLIGLYVGSRALATGTRAELRALGYDLEPAPSSQRDPKDWEPALRVVDERHLDRIPTPEEDRRTPVVVLTGARPLAVDDPRIIGRALRPADTLSLYPLFQKALETHPRRVPRVPTQLPARCIRDDRRWPGAVLSLSEGGCLLRTTEAMEPGIRFNLQFAIPGGQLITARARCVYSEQTGEQTGSLAGELSAAPTAASRGEQRSVGIQFCEPTAVDRRVIRGYVSQRLAVL